MKRDAYIAASESMLPANDSYRVSADVCELTQARLLTLLAYDPKTGEFERVQAPRGSRVGPVTGWLDKDGYRRIKVDYRVYPMHRLAWLYVYGEWPAGVIDHINRVKSDNRICNLRDASLFQNSHNVFAPLKNNRSGFRGVSPMRGQFRASIMARGRRFFLGLFKTPELASEAYVAAKEHLHES